MVGLIGVYVLVLVSMAARDCLGTISTACIVHGRKLLAGTFDGLCDIAGVVSITATGAVTLEHGLTLATVVAFAALFVGSLAGTGGGMTIAGWIETRFGRPLAPVPPSAPVATARAVPAPAPAAMGLGTYRGGVSPSYDKVVRS